MGRKEVADRIHVPDAAVIRNSDDLNVCRFASSQQRGEEILTEQAVILAPVGAAVALRVHLEGAFPKAGVGLSNRSISVAQALLRYSTDTAKWLDLPILRRGYQLSPIIAEAK